MRKMFEGVDELIDEALDVAPIGSRPHYRHKLTALGLNAHPPSLDGVALVRSILLQLEHNWRASREEGIIRAASPHNWRWSKASSAALANTSRERDIERAIVRDFDTAWVNQVPALAGLVSPDLEADCAVNLAHRVSDGVFEFIELKTDLDTPMLAAFDVLKCGLAYQFTRTHLAELAYDLTSPLLRARHITLCVLAPGQYYRLYDVRWLESAISSGLRSLASPHLLMDFRFDHFAHDANTSAEIIGSRVPLYAPIHRHAFAASPTGASTALSLQ